MGKIVLYRGDIEPFSLSFIKAEITFSPNPRNTGINNRKSFKSEDAGKGLEQLKRWVSTGAFQTVVIEDLYNALEKGAKEHVSEWISDHIPEPDSPSLVLVEDAENPQFLFKTIEAKTIDEVKDLINIK